MGDLCRLPCCTSLSALASAAQLRADRIACRCYIVNVRTQPSVMTVPGYMFMLTAPRLRKSRILYYTTYFVNNRNLQFQSYNVAAANFARGSENLLKRGGTIGHSIEYTKEENRVPSLTTRDLACTRRTKNWVAGKFV